MNRHSASVKGRTALVVAVVLVLVGVGVGLRYGVAWRRPAGEDGPHGKQPQEQGVTAEDGAKQGSEATAGAPRIDTRTPLAKQLQELQGLPRDLPRAEVKRVRALVQDRTLNETARNLALVALERQQQPVRELGSVLVDIWQDTEDTARMRDFALQHLPVVYGYATNQPEILAVLRQAAQEPSGRTMNHAGTAMMSLQTLGARVPAAGASARELARACMAADNEELDGEKAVVALQILRVAEDDSVLPRARRLAADEGALARLRLSAISLVATVGDRDDVPLLQRLTKDRDSRVRRVAGFQLKQLQKRCEPDA